MNLHRLLAGPLPWVSLCVVLAVGTSCSGEGDRRPDTGPVRASSAARAERPKPRLVVLFAPCTLSKTFLSPYDPSIPFTPNFGRIASEGVTFEAHRTEAGSSGIAYAALFSGGQVDLHGISAHPSVLPDPVYTVAEAFREAGYATAYWNGHPMVSSRFNYAQGADRFIAMPLEGSSPELREELAHLARDPERRLFIVANTKTTHGPYDPRPVQPFLARFPGERGSIDPRREKILALRYRENYRGVMYNFPAVLEDMSLTQEDVPALADTIERLYAANVWMLDGELGGILDAIDEFDLRDESIVAVTADHGEVLYREHEVFKWTHSGSVAHEVMEVPLIIRAPGVAPGRYEAVTRSIDVYPTLAGLAGIELPPDSGVAGRDLSAALYGEEEPPVLTAYSHTGGLAKAVVAQIRKPGAERVWGERMRRYPTGDFRHASTVLRRGDLVVKLQSIDGESFEPLAFDLASDPLEENDIFDPANPAHAEAVRDLRAYKERLTQKIRADGDGPPEEDASLDAEREKQLRALGYIE